MPTRNMSDEQMRAALKALEQAAFNHDQWAETLTETLICRLPPDRREFSNDAHRMCRFGQWYYGAGTEALKNYPGFAELGLEHQRMHQYAANLLRSSLDGTTITIEDYERFLSALKRMRLEIATVQREFEQALYSLDPLTGIPSRIGMLTKLREQHELVTRNVHACVVAMMDIDHFKAVNDSHGHVVGDRVLVSFAHYLASHLRPYDLVFRYGGEEFLICLPGTDMPGGREIIDRLRDEFGSMPQRASGKEAFYVTASAGLAMLAPEIPVEESIDRADKALYAAKASGRSRTVIWSATMNVPAARAARLA
jgi:diguanylate cyclase